MFSAKNSAGNTGTEVYGDLELTVNVNDVNDNNPVFSPASKCKELADGVSGRKYNLFLPYVCNKFDTFA